MRHVGEERRLQRLHPGSVEAPIDVIEDAEVLTQWATEAVER